MKLKTSTRYKLYKSYALRASIKYSKGPMTLYFADILETCNANYNKKNKKDKAIDGKYKL